MNITMLPGIYYMKSGSFAVGGGVTLNGTGVTIYMDNGGGQLSLQGGATVNLTPPTSGTYAGMTYFQDRSSSKEINIANGVTTNISGTLYAASANLTFAGGTSNKFGSQIVTKSLTVNNGATLNLKTTTDAKSGYTASGGSGGSSILIVE